MRYLRQTPFRTRTGTVTLSTRAVGVVAGLLAVVLGGIGGLAWRDWYRETYAVFASYPAAALRITAVCLMVVAILAGAFMSRRSVGLHRIGIILIVIAAVTTLAALKYAESAGGIHTHVLSGTTYVVIGAAQLACAGVLAGALALRLR